MKAAILLMSLLLAGCIPTYQDYQADQCLRQRAFKECMELTPAMPSVKVDQSTGDWAEVVKACSNHAYYVSRRLVESIEGGCK